MEERSSADRRGDRYHVILCVVIGEMKLSTCLLCRLLTQDENQSTSVTLNREGEEITEVIINKSSASVANLFNKQWLSRYPRAKNIIYDNGSEFKLDFQDLCK